jgi:hypothetical protein
LIGRSASPSRSAAWFFTVPTSDVRTEARDRRSREHKTADRLRPEDRESGRDVSFILAGQEMAAGWGDRPVLATSFEFAHAIGNGVGGDGVRS